MFKNKLDYILIVGFIFLPIILHLNEINLKQYQLSTINYLIIFQLLISITIILSSLLIYHFFLKKRFLSEILVCNFSTFYFLFYYKKVNSLKFVQSLENFNYLLDNLVSFVLYLILYMTTFYFLKRFNSLMKFFFLFFIVFNFTYGIYNMSPLKSIQFFNNKTPVFKERIELNSLKTPKVDKLTNVYLIVLDGMINLEKAENLDVIDSEIEIIQKLKDYNFNYNQLFKSNYSVTYASIQSLLYGEFPITENSKRYKNRLAFYPYNMSNKENFFYQIINKLNMNFFWIGNKWGLCKGLKYGECYYNYTDKKNFVSKLIFSSELFYMNSIFSYFFNYLNKDLVITAFDFLRYSENKDQILPFKNKANFFLVHVYKPHKPYNLDQNCNDVKPKRTNFDEIKYYKYQYNCVLDAVLKWDNKFLNKNENNIVIVLGDHGWSFDHGNKKDINFIKSRINNVFFAYKVPQKCRSIDVPNSHVNVMRFILRCLDSSNPKYLTDTQYILRYEGHQDYGKAIELIINE